MSKLKVDQISKATGASPAIFTLPAADGTVDQHLTTDGSGQLSFATSPAGGLTNASQWRLTTGFTGDKSPIDANLEEVDAPVGFGVLGSSMTESSGIFTFPSTGYWLITFDASYACNGDNQWLMAWIYTTTNDSTYAKAAEGNCPSFGGSTAINYPSTDASYIFDDTSTSTHKCAFYIDVQTTADATEGNTDRNKTYMTFVKMADT